MVALLNATPTSLVSGVQCRCSPSLLEVSAESCGDGREAEEAVVLP